MAKISGILNDPTGQPIQNCTIELKSQRNTANVLRTMTAHSDTSVAGAYSMEVYSGVYDVVLRHKNKAPLLIGSISVFDNSDDGSLNDFFMLSNGIDFNRELLNELKAMADDVTQDLISSENIVKNVKGIQQQIYTQTDEVILSTSNGKQMFEETKSIPEFITTLLNEIKHQVHLAKMEGDRAEQAAAMPVEVTGFYQVGCILMAVPNSPRILEPGETIDARSIFTIHNTTKNGVITYSFAKINIDGIWRANGKSYYIDGSNFGPALFVRIS